MTKPNSSSSQKLLDDGLPATGFVRPKQVNRPHGPLPIASSTLWAWVKAGRLEAIKIGPRVTVFRVDDIRALARQHFS